MLKRLQPIEKHSPALSRHLAKNPNEADAIAKLSSRKTSTIIAHFEKKFHSEATDGNILKSLRFFKYNVLSAPSIKYLTGKIDTEIFCSEWSRSAEKCCQFAYDYSLKQATQELGTPIVLDAEGKEIDFKFVVIALGKLGAGELNLSSDIDLLFLHNAGPGSIRGNSDSTLKEFTNRIAAIFTDILSKIDEDGFCFRVDNDLRPEGSKGQLSNSVEAALSYYEYWGTELERMMLIRANPVAGNLDLGEEFINKVRPFVYRRSWDLAALKKIKKMKAAIEHEAMKSSKDGIDVKRGDGGIREVEFVIQSIQLLHGGKDNTLIEKNTFKAIDAIRKKKLIPSRQCKQLKKAYLFLRHLENMIQLPNDEQTHILTGNPDQRKALAERMGYKDKGGKSAGSALMADFDEYTAIVKHHFRHMFESNFEKKQMEDAILTNISTCKGDEEDIDSLAWFKKEETKRIQYMDLQQNLSPPDISEKLTMVAEVIVSEAYKIASNKLRNTYGPPLTQAKGNPISSLAIVGVGKLGGKEIDYASDLDLMFIFSEKGNTAGPQVITNQEYFTKLSQRIMTLITLPTRYGKAYQIDTDLRPSGRAGILVTSLDTFKTYHNIEAELWERQALLKARPIAGDPKFCEIVTKMFNEIRYDKVLPTDYRERIRNLRIRMEKERAEETDNRYNIKLGFGGLMDIETVVQCLQLEHALDKSAIHSSNTLHSIKGLAARHILPFEKAAAIIEYYNFLRRVLGRIRLYSNHAIDHLDINSSQLEQVSQSLGFKDKNELIENIHKIRKEIRTIYNNLMKKR